MALTYTSYKDNAVHPTTNGGVTTTSHTYTSGNLVTVCYVTADGNSGGTTSISNSGTAQSWTKQKENATIDGTNCIVTLWSCVMSVTQAMTITCQLSASSASVCAFVIEHSGQHSTTPIPAGNIFHGIGGHNVTQSITPTSSGSCLWFFCGDWSATNSFTQIANCSQEQLVPGDGTDYSTELVRPTTQPRTDANAFTIGENETGGKIAWIAFEVQAAPATTIAWLKA